MEDKLSLAELLSPFPLPLHNGVCLKRPLLEDIAKIGFHNYTMFINVLSITFEEMLDVVKFRDAYNTMSSEEKSKISIYDLILLETDFIQLFLQIFNFFIDGTTVYNGSEKSFWILSCTDIKSLSDIDKKDIVGKIGRDNYHDLCQMILIINFVKTSVDDISKVKSKKAREIMEKIRAEKAKLKKNVENGKDYSLGNVISKVASNSNGINFVNIWRLTIYQLYNEFYEITYKKLSDMKNMNHAFAGGEMNFMDWIKAIED